MTVEDECERALRDEARATAHKRVEGQSPDLLRTMHPSWVEGVADEDVARVVEDRLATETYRELHEEAAEDALSEARQRRADASRRAKINADRRRAEASLRERGVGVINVSFRATAIKSDLSLGKSGASALELSQALTEVLGALGIEADIDVARSGKSADVKLVVPSNVHAIERRRTRNAGRPRSEVCPYNLAKYPDINNETTWREFLGWAKSHKATECAEALGLSRSSYYRRLPEIRERVERDEIRNEGRRRDGESEVWSTLGNGSREVPPEEWRERLGEGAAPSDGGEAE